MEDGLTEAETPGQTSLTPYGDLFDKLAPHYIAMGMTYEQYWDGEYGMKKAYREAYKIRTENEQLLADRQNWYLGQYIASVLQAVPLLVSGLNVKPSTRLPDYPEKPFYETFRERKQEAAKKKAEEDQTRLAMAMMQARFEQFNKRFMSQAEEGPPVGTGQ